MTTHVDSATPLRPAPSRPANRRNAWPWVLSLILFMLVAAWALNRLSDDDAVRSTSGPVPATIAPDASPAESSRTPVP